MIEPARVGTVVARTVTYNALVAKPVVYLYVLEDDGKWWINGRGAIVGVPYSWDDVTTRKSPVEKAIEVRLFAVRPSALLEDLATEILESPENWLDVKHVGRWLKELASSAAVDA